LGRLDDELRFVLITSDATVDNANARPATATPADISGAELEDGELWIVANASPHPKCVRCWHHREEVGNSKAHPELCGRCIENVDGDGEPRRFT